MVSLHDCYIGFAGATPNFDAIGPYRLEYCFRDEHIKTVNLISVTLRFCFEN